MTFKRILKHNPNHDQKGRFATAPGGPKAPAEKPKPISALAAYALRNPQNRVTDPTGGKTMGKPATTSPQGLPIIRLANPEKDGAPGGDYPPAEVAEGMAMMFGAHLKMPDDPVFYHGTASECLESIQKAGLSVQHAGNGADSWAIKNQTDPDFLGRTPSIYMSPYAKVADGFAKLAVAQHPGSKAAVLRIKLPKEAIGKVREDEAFPLGFRYEGDIKPEWISLVANPPEGPAPFVSGPSHKSESDTVYMVILCKESA